MPHTASRSVPPVGMFPRSQSVCHHACCSHSPHLQQAMLASAPWLRECRAQAAKLLDVLPRASRRSFAHTDAAQRIGIGIFKLRKQARQAGEVLPGQLQIGHQVRCSGMLRRAAAWAFKTTKCGGHHQQCKSTSTK